MFPDWKNCLPLLLETLGEKYKHKKSNPRKESKSKKSRTLKIEDNSGTWLVEPITWKRSIVNVEGNHINKQSCQSIQEFNDTSKREKYKKQIERSIEEHSIEQECVVKDTTKKNSASSDTGKDSSENCSIEDVLKIEGAVDPFFLTKDNAEYVSISIKNNANNPREISRTPHNQQEFDNNLRFKKQKCKPYQYDRREYHDQRIKKRDFQSNNFGKREFSRDNRSYSHNGKIPVEPSSILHPSWEAKKKLSQLVQFEGKKVKFDDS